MFCIWTLACALAPNWPAFLVFRLLVGVFASASIALVTGVMADVYGEYRTRGRAMASYFAVSPNHVDHRSGTHWLTRLETPLTRPPSSARSLPRSYPASAPQASVGGGHFGSA